MQVLKMERPKWKDPNAGRHVHFPEQRHREVNGSLLYGKPVIRLVSEFRCLLCGDWHEMIQGREEIIGMVSGTRSVIREARTTQRREVDLGNPHHSHLVTLHHKRSKIEFYTTKKWAQLVGAMCAARFRSLVDSSWRIAEVVGGASPVRIPFLPIDLAENQFGAYYAEGNPGEAPSPVGPSPFALAEARGEGEAQSLLPKGYTLLSEEL